ncbi:UNVERIFIED_CONTAM: LINE-1 retrotransposable element O protein [Sesamum latifolium]|uniref:LINE-1 retrotransposable element O protein n=1 Tax=Sesamum latifolium TaxID=2727402 RepID=A0AAW2XH40_9LAMI
MPRKVSNKLNEALLQPFSPDEVRRALFQMYPYKSPGPDGMSPVFYQKYLHIIGPEITSFVLEFLNQGHLDSRFNYTYIVLIPKCDSPESAICVLLVCNISYKIASKMLANRLKPLSHTIISESQLAFIPGRLISDNVLVAYKLNHYLAHKTWGSVGHAALKLDLSKAYDRVEWSFLESVLAKLATRDAMLCVGRILKEFEEASGLMMNLEKSSMAFSKNTPDAIRADLANVLGVRVVDKHEKYLGLPAFVGRSKREVFQFIKDKVWSRLQSWRCQMLSQVDVEVILGIAKAAGSPDQLRWHYEKHGCYSVRSAYRLIIDGAVPLLQLGPAGLKSYKSEGWGFVWNVAVPPKVKLFAWHVCRDALPTSSNLVRRGVQLEGVCLGAVLRGKTVPCSPAVPFAHLVWAMSDHL